MYHQSFRTELEKPIILKTINSKSISTTKIRIPFFKEFNIPEATIELLECDISGDYDGILGCNVLRPLQIKIDLEENKLTTHHTELPLLFDIGNNKQLDINDIYFDVIDINFHKPDIGNLIDRLQIDHLNEEEISKLLKIIKEFNKTFYIEGDNLTAVCKYKHRINTTNDIPVYSRTYRFPEIHKTEVEKQVKEMLNSGIIKKINESLQCSYMGSSQKNG